MRNIHTLNPLKGAFGWSCLDNILYAVFSLTCYSQFFDFEMVFFGRMVHGHRKQLKVSSTRLALLHTRTSSSRFRSGCLEKPTSIWRVWKLKMELPTDIWMAISKKSHSALPHLSWLGAWLPAYSMSRLFWNFYINSYVTLCDCSRPSNRP